MTSLSSPLKPQHAHYFPTLHTAGTYPPLTVHSPVILRRLPPHYATANPTLSMEKLKEIITLTGGVNQRDIDRRFCQVRYG